METPPAALSPGATPSKTTAEEVFYDVAHQHLLAQMSRHESLDAKVLAAFSFGSTVLPITFGLLSTADQDEPKSNLVRPLIYAAVFVYAVVLFFSA